MTDHNDHQTYDPPTVTDLGTIRDLTASGTLTGLKEGTNLKT
jgi:hypothetical protein